jgi:heptosyltransferase-1
MGKGMGRDMGNGSGKPHPPLGGNPISAGILVVRLGAMGDILHALPAAASLKHSFPASPLTWVVENTWAPLLQNNSFIDRVVTLDRRNPGTWLDTVRELREQRFSIAMDFQGLLKSAITASLARPDRIFGYSSQFVRERMAAWFYSSRVSSAAIHIVDRHLDIAAAAGAVNLLRSFPLPLGTPEGDLPEGPFVLACPFAGWKGKQWPLESYSAVGRELEERWGIPLVLNGPPAERAALASAPGVRIQTSSISGLIDATRRATAILGVDSGPMHLAAALSKPGVAIFGPTDPARNGPYGGSLQVLRSPRAKQINLTRGNYRRGTSIDPTMRDITPEQVLSALASILN